MWLTNIRNIKIDKLNNKNEYDTRYSLSFECDYEDAFVGDIRRLLIEIPNTVLSFSQANRRIFDFSFEAIKEQELVESSFAKITVIE